MPSDWDPLSPAVHGPALVPTKYRAGVRLDGATRMGAAKQPALAATQTVTAASPRLEQIVGTATYRMEVWPAASLPISGALGTTILRPNLVEHGGDGTSSGVASFAASRIDETTIDTADYILVEDDDPVDVTFDTSAGLGAGSQTVTSLLFRAWFDGLNNTTITLALRMSGLGAVATHEHTLSATGLTQLVEWELFVNPNTGAPWTEAEIALLDTTTKLRVTRGNGGATKMFMVEAPVEHFDGVATATADLELSEGDDGWPTFTFVSSFSKVLGTALLVTLRRIAGSGAATWMTHDTGDVDLVPSGWGMYRPAVSEGGQVTDLGDLGSDVPGLILHITGTASVDSMPLGLLGRAAINADSGLVRQEYTVGSTADRQWSQVLVAAEHDEGPTGPLIVKMSNGAGTQLGGDLIFDPDVVADDPRALHALDGTFETAGAMTSGTQYRLDYTSPDSPDGRGWVVAYNDADSPPVSGNIAGFGGTTDRGTVAGVGADDFDLFALLGTAPAAPSGFSVTEEV